MPTDPYRDLQPAGEVERAYLESLIREDFERCHLGETLDDIKRRASVSKEDRGLLRNWMAIAAKQRCGRSAKASRLNPSRAGGPR